ncbi:MAG: cobyrinate a,c-diamide synthase [Spirulina sp. SIO3F2]|nr:cobyrinate a,c-diamide synthase [Spirulina sp. SIO3F2]
MTLIIAGDRSNSGKTTVTLAILSYLRQQGLAVQSFKVGPDYIDPMFHSKITGRPCRNLDPILTSPDYMQRCFAHHSAGVDYNLIEGVMGLFDGIGNHEAPPHVPVISGCPAIASTAYIARLLKIPVLLVIDCCSLSGSVAAIAQGYQQLDPQLEIAGVVFNRVGSERHLELLTQAIVPLGLPVLGTLFRNPDLILPDRHLGLVPVDELPELPQFFERLAQQVQDWDWEQLLPLLQSSGRVAPPLWEISPTPESVPIAIACDRAFNFYYADNLDLLQAAGAELIPWSPLAESLPLQAQGVYLGGGFPEMFAMELAANKAARDDLNNAIAQGLPVYAECGGLMYLCEAITTFEGETWPMVGVLPATVRMGRRLTLGYRRAIAEHSSLIVQDAECFWGHEFHRSQLSQLAPQPLWTSCGLAHQAQPYPEGWSYKNVQAAYLHLHWGDRPDVATRLVSRAREWGKF